MAKKIEGYVDGTGEGPEFTPYKEGNQHFPFWEAQGITLKPKFDYWRKAVVVVTDERVFTESEVRAIMGPLHTLARSIAQADMINSVEYCEASEVSDAFRDLKAVAIRLGLYSDPA